MTGSLRTDDPVWYVAYASNMSSGRLLTYLRGGRPPGARRTYEGCRDPSPPTRDVALTLPGRLAFAGRSSVWGGAMAFHDPSVDGEVVARGYRVTFGQLSDLVSQESRHPVGRDLATGREARRSLPTPSLVYESLLYLGDRDDSPMFCLTSHRALDPAPPSPAYLRTILVGLHEVRGWMPSDSARYLLGARGVSPGWSEDRITRLSLPGGRGAQVPTRPVPRGNTEATAVVEPGRLNFTSGGDAWTSS